MKEQVDAIRRGQIPKDWQTDETMMAILEGLAELPEGGRFQVRCEIEERIMVEKRIADAFACAKLRGQD